MTRLWLTLVTLFIILFGVQRAIAASVAIAPTGNGSFNIIGNGMDGIYGIELNLAYDTSSLASPSVSQGSLISGAMMAANTNNPGSIKVAIINTKSLSGSGQIAALSFASHTGTGSLSISAHLYNSKGAAVSEGGMTTANDFKTATTGSAGIASPGIPFSESNSTSTTIAARTSSGTAYLGTVSIPSDAQAKIEEKPADTSGAPREITEPTTVRPAASTTEEKAVSASKKPEKVITTAYKSTLENFRSFKGDKTAAGLIELFSKQIAPTIRQEPAFAVSDGKTPLKIHAEIRSAGEKSPNFALTGAKLVSLNVDSASYSWVVEVLPQTGVVQASMTILTDSEIIEYPLTVAPLVEGVSPAETDFAVFLTDSGAKAPKRDLNGDGRHDFLDDFIYTANFMTKKSAGDKTKK